MNKGTSTTLSRRELLRGGSLYAGGLALAITAPRPMAAAMAQQNSAAVSLNATQWAEAEAITARIIPTDDEPGAVEANCVNFIDKALANEDAAAKPDFLLGLEALDGLCQKKFKHGFAALDASKQDALLKSMELDEAQPWSSQQISAASFFEMVRAMTIMGFLADPKYGGNQNFSGWRVTHYPGPRHHLGGYTPAQMVGEEEIITIWGDKQ